jgi:hypothetical protein
MLSLIAVAVWFGAAILFAAVVAPAAFAVYPSRTLAGALVGRVLPPLFWSGLVVGIAVVAVTWSSPARPARWAAAVLAVSCAIGQLIVAPRIARIRDQIGGSIEALDQTDPLRVAFGRLHAQSVGWLALGMVSAFAVLVILARSVTLRTAP